MPRFILIDPWLSDAGGHNFQYALDVAHSAQHRGYEVVLAVHRGLPQRLRFPSSWRVLRLFRYGSCARHWLGPIGRNRYPCDLDGAWLTEKGDQRAGLQRSLSAHLQAGWRWCLDWPAYFDRRRRILDFAKAGSRLFDLIEPFRDDLIYLPSMSEFDFLGAARFLRDDRRTVECVWHLQFHFNVFVGRDPEFDTQQDRLQRFRLQLQHARREIPDHQLRLYATTPAMARQFNHVGMGSFDPLPYPVRPIRSDLLLGAMPAANVSPSASYPLDAQRPLRITFAGAMRREKGKKKLGALIDAVWSDGLADGRMQFVFQSTPRHVARWLPPHLRSHAKIAPVHKSDTAPLLTVKYPLDAEQYAELLRRTDLGIFLYDSRRYYARASGILCEMLAAGVPVIVPAGCWLSDQIAAENYRHATELARTSNVAIKRWQSLGIDRHGHTSMSIPLSGLASDLVVEWDWPASLAEGTYLQVSAAFSGTKTKTPNSAATYRTIVSRPEEGRASVVLPVSSSSRELEISLCSAYSELPVSIGRLDFTELRPPERSVHHPRGRVGLIAAAEGQVPDLLREITTHYDHYRATATAYSSHWLRVHHPDRTLELLEARDQPSTTVRHLSKSA